MKKVLKSTISKKINLSRKKLIDQPLKILKNINLEKLTKFTSSSLIEKYNKDYYDRSKPQISDQEFDLLKIVSTSVKLMSEGELLQIEKARKLDIEEDVYFDIITKKTATLIASCCATGAKSAKQSDEIVEKLRLFGEKVGISFQIKDDLFDYGSGENLGKPTGIDIKEKKMTLPLIYALRKADKSKRRQIINIVKQNNNNEKKIKQVIDFVIDSGGLEYATKKMLGYRDEALAILSEFENNGAKESLRNLVLYTTERTK